MTREIVPLRRGVRFALAAALLLVVLGGCVAGASSPEGTGEPAGAASPTAVPPTPRQAARSPEEVVAAFYDWYLAQSASVVADLQAGGGVLADSGYVTSGFVGRTRETLASFQGGGVDPIICAQDVPHEVHVQGAVVSADGQAATVAVGSSFPGHRLEVRLLREDDVWRIDGIGCLPSQAAAREPSPAATRAAPTAVGWARRAAEAESGAVYDNATYGVRFRYPAGWTAQELVAAPDHPPIGPDNVKVVVHLQPAEWAQARPDPQGPGATPFVMEISLGSLEAYRATNMEPERSEDVPLGDLVATLEVERITDDLTLHRYVFVHPGNPDLRVTFIDPISGFPERLAASGWAVEALHGMLATLGFVD